jgi:hypothetical protein
VAITQAPASIATNNVTTVTMTNRSTARKRLRRRLWVSNASRVYVAITW